MGYENVCITWSPVEFAGFDFQLVIDGDCNVVMRNPFSVAAVLFATAKRAVKFANSAPGLEREFLTLLPLNDDDLKGLLEVAGEDEELTNFLAAIFMAYCQIQNAYDSGRVPKEWVERHWHAACRFLPQELVVKRPASPPPENLESWFRPQKQIHR